jgi:hypothetical protein
MRQNDLRIAGFKIRDNRQHLLGSMGQELPEGEATQRVTLAELYMKIGSTMNLYLVRGGYQAVTSAIPIKSLTLTTVPLVASAAFGLNIIMCANRNCCHPFYTTLPFTPLGDERQVHLPLRATSHCAICAIPLT